MAHPPGGEGILLRAGEHCALAAVPLGVQTAVFLAERLGNLPERKPEVRRRRPGGGRKRSGDRLRPGLPSGLV